MLVGGSSILHRKLLCICHRKFDYWQSVIRMKAILLLFVFVMLQTQVSGFSGVYYVVRRKFINRNPSCSDLGGGYRRNPGKLLTGECGDLIELFFFVL